MGSTVEVLPDVTGLDRTFHYRIEEGALDGPLPLAVGTIVRVELHGRRVRGWVVGIDTPVPARVELRPVLELVSAGPPPEVVELCRWAAWRYAGRLRVLLVAASPERVVRELPSRAVAVAGAAAAAAAAAGVAPAGAGVSAGVGAAVAEALAARDAVLRLPPAFERLPVVEAVLTGLAPGDTALVLVEEREDVGRLAALLRRGGRRVACLPDDWAIAASGSAAVVVGTRGAVFAPFQPAVCLVLDAHSEAYRSPKAPCYDARVVAAERARRDGAAVVFVTPCPSVELLADGRRRLVTLPASTERQGWGSVAVLDVREEDPREGGYPSRLVTWIREAAAGRAPVVCVLNRVGRARLLTCGSCRQVQRCPRCGAAQVQLERPAKGEIGTLSCPRCGDAQPAICPSCGAGRLRVARPGVSRAREQLAAVTGLDVGEVSGPRSAVPPTPVVIGTEAVLHRVRSASLVVWLDFDQELLGARLRAAEEAYTKLARSVRLSGRRGGGPRVVIRTSVPDHEVVRAAQLGDPALVLDAERERRQLLRLPPFSALARLEGEGAADLAAQLVARGNEVEVSRLDDRAVLLRSERAEALADALGALAAADPAGWAGLGARVEMEPVDL